MLKNSSESGHPYLFPDLSRKAPRFKTLNIRLAVGLFVVIIYHTDEVSSIPSLLRCFNMNGYWIL